MTSESKENHSKSINCWWTVGSFGDGSCEQLEDLFHCRECHVCAAAGQQLRDREVQEDYLGEWSDHLAEKETPEETKTLSLMVFRLQKEWFALKTGLFDEVAEVTLPHSIPGKTDYRFRGLVSISGELRLLFSLSAIIGITNPIETPAEDKSRPRLAVIGRGQDRVAFSVEEIFGVFAVSEHDFEALPATLPGCGQHLSSRSVSIEGRKVEVLDEDKLLDALTRSLVS
jgi:chemotaxis-related protein WspD